ncbi:MAG TPA: TIGR03790 family protein [Rhodocyclaceae bacterium]|nr:TIGR03790 family protein [Rhodocyclaceae bacterium]
MLLVVAPDARAQFAKGAFGWPSVLYASEVAVVVNLESPESVELGEYYRRVRHIPERNMIRVRIPGSPRVLSPAAFAFLKGDIDRQLDPSIEAMVLVWTTPYAVDCNSITSALTLGYQPELCLKTCNPSKVNPYFDAHSSRPFSDFGLRLAMLLPTESIELGRALIDRGVASDGTSPAGTAYFLKTSDKFRNSRAGFFPPSGRLTSPPLSLRTLNADSIQGRRDVMFYFTGAVSVPYLDTLRFLPGAVADHLTSSGGVLLGSGQMSSLRWLEAGATASYGTVSEPCNYWQKFPNPAVFLRHYLAGDTVIEAYWKSVAWPAQGVFIGEPLAAPYRH